MRRIRIGKVVRSGAPFMMSLAAALGIAACELDSNGDLSIGEDGGMSDIAAEALPSNVVLRYVDYAADFNGDGYKDVAIAGTSDKVNVYMSANLGGLPTVPTKVITAPTATDGTFFGVGNCGNINKDGYDDLVIGANDVEAAYVYLGSSTGLPSAPSQTIAKPAEAGAFGFSSIGGIDANNDGYSDVVIGAPGTNMTKGAAYIYYGSAGGLSTAPAITLTGSGEIKANFGHAFEVGFLNGDGYKDLIVTEHYYTTKDTGAKGRVYVYFGGAAGLSTTPAAVLTCPDGDYKGFGKSVTIARDFDGDKIGDLIVGAWGVNSKDGRAYLYRGTATGLSTTPSVTFMPTAGTHGYFGYAVLATADFNYDGYSDVAIGETDAAGLKGQAHVFHGGPLPYTVTSTNHKVLTGTHTGTGYFGQSLTMIKKGAGYDSLIVGAPWADSGPGRVYQFNGSATGITTTPVKTLKGTVGTSDHIGMYMSR